MLYGKAAVSLNSVNGGFVRISAAQACQTNDRFGAACRTWGVVRRRTGPSPLYRFSGMPRMTAFEFLGQFLWQNSFEQLSGILIHHEHVAVPAPVHRRINVTAIFAIGRNSSPCQTAFLPLRIHV